MLSHPSGKLVFSFERSLAPDRGRRWRIRPPATHFSRRISRRNNRRRIFCCNARRAPLHRHRQFGRICFGTWGVVSRHETNTPDDGGAANNEELSPRCNRLRGKSSLMSTTENNTALIERDYDGGSVRRPGRVITFRIPVAFLRRLSLLRPVSLYPGGMTRFHRFRLKASI